MTNEPDTPVAIEPIDLISGRAALLLTLDRSRKRNCLSADTLEDLHAAIATAARSVIVLAANGDLFQNSA